MKCQQIKLMMHEALDEDSRASELCKLIDSHCSLCPSCKALWLDFQNIEIELTNLERVEVPLDFSNLNWATLALEEANKEASLQKVVPQSQLVNILLGLGIMILAMWGIVEIGQWQLFIAQLWNMVTIGIAETMVSYGAIAVKNIFYWWIMANAMWKGFLSLVIINITSVLSIVAASALALIYLFKLRRIHLLNVM
ncbi:MAG: hypothetical protein SCK28_05975 [Bacillota bacterium]|nr:hypothetical protein [Bacillota bacterium]